MAEVTATLVKELRDKTGAGMMDCKKALIESEGDIEVASDWLRKKGLAAAAKKAGRVAAEGLVGVCVDGKRGAVVEVNAETDFVARNDTFRDFVRTMSKMVLQHGDDVAVLNAAKYPGTGRTVAEELTDMIATIGENMNLRRAALLSVEKGVMASYVHNAQEPGLGKIAVLVGLETSGNAGQLEQLGKQLAMHVAAEAHVERALQLALAVQVAAHAYDSIGRPDMFVTSVTDGHHEDHHRRLRAVDRGDPARRLRGDPDPAARGGPRQRGHGDPGQPG